MLHFIISVENPLYNCYYHLMNELTSKQRITLSAMANGLNPVVIVGGAGVTSNLEEQVLNCLNDHELIKVKFNEFKDQKAELSKSIAEKCNAALVRVIGNVAIFYKESDDPDKRQIVLEKQ